MKQKYEIGDLVCYDRYDSLDPGGPRYCRITKVYSIGIDCLLDLVDLFPTHGDVKFGHAWSKRILFKFSPILVNLVDKYMKV